MSKLKTKKSAFKRYKVTANKQFLHHHAFKGHLLLKKSNRQKRKLSQVRSLSNADKNSVRLMLPYC